MKIFNPIIFVIFLIVTLKVFADEIHSVEVVGEGSTRQEAIYNGLIRAVGQVNGLAIASETKTDFSFKEFSSSILSYQLDSSESKSSLDKDISTKSKGIVDGYEILESNITNNGFEVRLVVDIAKYKTPGISPHSRRKIAVIPFRTTKPSYHFQGQRISSDEISRLFTQKLVTEMSQNRKWTVLDREYMDEFLGEKNLLLSADAPMSEQIKVGEVLGADYLLIGTITDVLQKRTNYNIEVSDETGYRQMASFIADYRIVIVATHQIKWADSVTITLADNAIKRMVPNLDPGQIRQLLLSRGAKQIVNGAMANIYPMRVVSVQPNGDVVLNQGGVSVSGSQILDVFNPGEVIVDPYTGESLGAVESWVATIKITRVTPKMSFARVIKGESSSIQNGGIVRGITGKTGINSNSSERKSTGKPIDIQFNSGGGVVLPFD